MKNKLFFHKTLLLSIILTIIIGILSISSAGRKLEFGYHWKTLISNLSHINNEINFLLEKVYLDPRYDDIMILGDKFERSINDILLANSKYYGSRETGLEDMKRIRRLFNSKFDLIYSYTSIVSLSRALYVNLNEDRSSKYFEEIMPNLLVLKYDIMSDFSSLNEKIDRLFVGDDLKVVDVEFLRNTKVLIEHYMRAQGVLKQMQSIGLQIELNDVAAKNQNYIYTATKGLENLITLFVFCLIIIASLSFFAYVDTKRVYDFTSYLKQGLNNAFSSIFLINKNKSLMFANNHFLQARGQTLQEFEKSDLELMTVDTTLKGNYLDIANSIQNAEVWQNIEFINTRQNGDIAYENIRVTPLIDSKRRVDGYVFVKLDRTKEVFAIKELEKRESEIERRAYIDTLTGLGNYYSLARELEKEQIGTIIYISINNFMDFRFFYKASTIELIVTSFARSLKLCLDAYSIKANIYRVQFDEFYIWYNGNDIKRDVEIMKGYINSENLSIIVDGKRENIANIKTTIGVSLMQDTRQTTRITQAMLAHHDARNKNESVSYYTENSATEQQYYHNQIMSRTIEYAIYKDTIIVECQGIYDVSDPEIEPYARYYEILVRLIDENGKTRYPGEFLDIAKKISLHNEITKKVIEHAFRLIERFPDISFSINLSSGDIENEDIRDLLEQKLQICSYPDHLYCEILESEGMQDYKIVNEFIRKIRSHNCKISIDDFGSGYSNYYRLLELDIDVIKIDGSIVKKLPYDKNARDLLATIIDFANRQDYGIVAEFVSTPEILEEVRKFGIKYAQGFLLGKPISPDKI